MSVMNNCGRWEAEGKDVPGGRCRRSVLKGLTNAPDDVRTETVRKRMKALNRMRLLARGMEEKDRNAMWAVVPQIGLNGFPSWDEFVECRTDDEFLVLASRGRQIEKAARLKRDVENSAKRTCAMGVDDYLNARFDEGYSPFSDTTVTSVLRRMLAVEDHDGVRYAERAVSSLRPRDARRITEEMSIAQRGARKGERVEAGTRGKNLRYLAAWFEFEIKKEHARAQEEERQPLFAVNPFRKHRETFTSGPVPGRPESAQVKESGRRFFGDEIEKLDEAADYQCRYAWRVSRRLGLRPGELIHLRYGVDVKPLPEGSGYEVVIVARKRDSRCSCPGCGSPQGWAPKNGARHYWLERAADRIGWATPACDALDEWIAMRKPRAGDFLFPSYEDPNRAWSNADLNRRLRLTGEKVGTEIGQETDDGRTSHSWRHTCASEMLELGIQHAYAAEWIGDTISTFKKTYGRPDPRLLCAAILAGPAAPARKPE